MTNDDQPGYSGADLMAGALAAIERSPAHAPSIRVAVQRLARRAEGDEPIDALDRDVAVLIQLIERAGVPAPPLHSQNPRGQHGPTADYGDR